MTDLVLIVLQMLKIAFFSAGTIGVVIVLLYTIDLLIEEYNLYKEKWGTREVPAVVGILSHRATRAQLREQLKEQTQAAWEKYFFEDIGRHRVDEKSAYTHPYIAVRPRLRRFVVELEPSHA
jgi:hypothetical protein